MANSCTRGAYPPKTSTVSKLTGSRKSTLFPTLSSAMRPRVRLESSDFVDFPSPQASETFRLRLGARSSLAEESLQLLSDRNWLLFWEEVAAGAYRAAPYILGKGPEGSRHVLDGAPDRRPARELASSALPPCTIDDFVQPTRMRRGNRRGRHAGRQAS